MNRWQCTVEFALELALTHDQIDALLERLRPHAPALSVDDTRPTVSAVMTIDKDDVLDAAANALHLLTQALHKTGARITTKISVEAINEAEANRRLAESTFPEMVAATEAARILGVSRQRFPRLAGENAFPAPAVHLSLGPLWTRASIEAFNNQWERKVSRPPKQTAPSPVRA